MKLFLLICVLLDILLSVSYASEALTKGQRPSKRKIYNARSTDSYAKKKGSNATLSSDNHRSSSSSGMSLEISSGTSELSSSSSAHEHDDPILNTLASFETLVDFDSISSNSNVYFGDFDFDLANSELYDDLFDDSPVVPDSEANILFAANFNSSCSESGKVPICDEIDKSRFKNKYEVDHNWPGFVEDEVSSLSCMSFRMKKAAIASIIYPKNNSKFYEYLKFNLFDTTKPIAVIDARNNNTKYITWFHLILSQKVINQEALDIALNYLSIETLNRPDSQGLTPLYTAIGSGCLHSVQKLLDHGAECNLITSVNLNPLLFTLALQSFAMFKLLLNSGEIDVNIRSLCGNFGFMHFVMKYKDLSILKEILNASPVIKMDYLLAEIESHLNLIDNDFILTVILAVLDHPKRPNGFLRAVLISIVNFDKSAILLLELLNSYKTTLKNNNLKVKDYSE